MELVPSHKRVSSNNTNARCVGGRRSHYDVLGVTKNATLVELRKARRRLLLQCHPDRQARTTGQGQDWAGEFAKEVTEAYAVLSDPERRRQYDAEQKGGITAKTAAFWSCMEQIGKQLWDTIWAEKQVPLPSPMSVMMRSAEGGGKLNVAYEELKQEVEHARQEQTAGTAVDPTKVLPEDLCSQLDAAACGFVTRAVQRAFAANFTCAHCRESIVDLDALCYCHDEQTHHLLTADHKNCCPKSRRR